MKRNKHRKQYLNGLTPLYRGELQKMALLGLIYVVECIDSSEPLPEGFTYLEEALDRASELNDLLLDSEDGGWFAEHRVYRLEQDDSGEWFTTFESVN